MSTIVSRTRLAKDHQFTREPGFALWTLSVRTSGRMAFESGGERTVVEPWTMVLTRPGHAYGVRALPGQALEELAAVFMPRAECELWMDWPQSLPGTSLVPLRESGLRRTILAAFDEAVQLAEWRWPVRPETSPSTAWRYAMVMSALERVVMLTGLTVGAGTVRLDPRIERAIGFLRDNLGLPTSLGDLADHAELSPSQFSLLFTRDIGQSPMAYAEGLRMQRARELLLTTNLPIAEVAQRVGFANPFHFSKRFAARVGQSPRVFRSGSGRAKNTASRKSGGRLGRE